MLINFIHPDSHSGYFSGHGITCFPLALQRHDESVLLLPQSLHHRLVYGTWCLVHELLILVDNNGCLFFPSAAFSGSSFTSSLFEGAQVGAPIFAVTRLAGFAASATTGSARRTLW